MSDDYEYMDEDDIDLSEIDGPSQKSSGEFTSIEDDELDDAPEYSGGGGDSDEVGGSDMQHMLLSYLGANQQLWIKCAPIVKEEYFDAEFRSVVKLFREYEQKNQTMPNPLVVRADTAIDLDLPDDAKHPMVAEDIVNRVEEFCRHAATINLLHDSYDAVQEDKSRKTVANIVKEMERIASMSAQQDLGYEVHDDAKELLVLAEKSDGLPTGFRFLDTVWNGGVTNPSFNLVSAASGQGKSIFLQNLAVNYARQGHNVVYISLELPEFMVQKRFSAMMTGIDINMVFQNLDTVITKLKRDKRKEGRIQIKRLPITGTTVADIRAYVNELVAATGEEWNHIMVDYMDIMDPMRAGIRHDNIHLKDKAISEELYEWTHDKLSSKTIWSASQQTKGAKEEKDARQGAVAGGAGKVNTCDNLLILKRTLEDIQDQRTIGYIEKGRNGGQGMRVPFHWHSGTQRMTNPEDMDDFFLELNTPGAKESDSEGTGSKKKKLDPLVRAKQAGQSEVEKDKNKVRDRIMNRRGK